MKKENKNDDQIAEVLINMGPGGCGRHLDSNKGHVIQGDSGCVAECGLRMAFAVYTTDVPDKSQRVSCEAPNGLNRRGRNVPHSLN